MTNLDILFQLGFLLIALNWFLCIHLAWKHDNKTWLYIASILTILYVMIGSTVIAITQ